MVNTNSTSKTTKHKATAPHAVPAPPVLETISPVMQSKRSRRALPWIVTSVILSIALVVGAASIGAYLYATHRSIAVLTPARDGNTTATASEASVSNVIEKVSPSVVSIVTNTTKRTIYGAAQARAAGTGIVISRDGYILTNRHVVANASTVQVVLDDGTAYDDVKIVGVDPLNDVAYLKINGVTNLRAAEIGDSSTVRTGQQVVAIGNALGQYRNTVSSGIISGKGRSLSASDEAGGSNESLSDMFQTDAAINSGNSGGPLLNYAGQVIGINTAVASGATGIGFAIPINAVKGTMKSVLAGNRVKRAYIGIRYVDITPALAKRYHLPVTKGAYVASDNSSSVQPGSPASKAGIQDEDIITKVNGTAVGESNGFSSLIGQYTPNDVVELTILRGGKEQTVKVTLGAYAE